MKWNWMSLKINEVILYFNRKQKRGNILGDWHFKYTESVGLLCGNEWIPRRICACSKYYVYIWLHKSVCLVVFLKLYMHVFDYGRDYKNILSGKQYLIKKQYLINFRMLHCLFKDKKKSKILTSTKMN